MARTAKARFRQSIYGRAPVAAENSAEFPPIKPGVIPPDDAGFIVETALYSSPNMPTLVGGHQTGPLGSVPAVETEGLDAGGVETVFGLEIIEGTVSRLAGLIQR